MWKHVRNIVLIFIVLGLIGAWFMTRPDEAKLPLASLEGPKPELTQPRPETFPTRPSSGEACSLLLTDGP